MKLVCESFTILSGQRFPGSPVHAQASVYQQVLSLYGIDL